MTQADNPRSAPGGNELRQYVERVNKLEEEKAVIGSDLRELFAEAKNNGYDAAALRAVAKREREEADKAAKRREREALIDTYASALGIAW